MKTKVKDLIKVLQELDPEKEVIAVSTYDSYKVEGVYDAEHGVEIELERKA
jgi:hypothetical protein